MVRDETAESTGKDIPFIDDYRQARFPQARTARGAMNFRVAEVCAQSRPLR